MGGVYKFNIIGSDLRHKVTRRSYDRAFDIPEAVDRHDKLNGYAALRNRLASVEHDMFQNRRQTFSANAVSAPLQ